MALSASTIWEIENGGSDTNGGGYVSGGTDYSQQTSAQIAVSDAVAAGTTTITSATASFNSNHVGNLIYLSGGSGSLAATRRQVISVSNATTIIVDATVATGTGLTLNLGGALATPAELSQTTPRGMAIGNLAYWKYNAAAWTTSSTVTLSSGGTAGICRIIGYDTTRTETNNDANMPTLQASASMTNVLALGTYCTLRNVIVDGNGTGKGARTIVMGSNYGQAIRCKVKNFIDIGIYIADPYSIAYLCEATTGTAAAQGALFAGNNGALFLDCYSHDNLCNGAKSNSRGAFINCLIINNTGASTDGIQTASSGSTAAILNCTIYGNGRHSINLSSSIDWVGAVILNNICALNGGYGIFNAGTENGQSRLINYNAFWNNSSGPVSGISAGPNDVILSGDPFTNAASGIFSLNNTAGAGASCRAAGNLGTFLNSSTTAYFDIGAVQHQDSGSGSIGIEISNTVPMGAWQAVGY